MTQTSIALMWVVLVQSFLWKIEIKAIISDITGLSHGHHRSVTELSQSHHRAVTGPSQVCQRAVTGLSKGSQRTTKEPSQGWDRVVTGLSQGRHRGVTGSSHCLHNYLAPLKREINERNDVILKAMRPGTISDGMNTEDAEIILNIILGIKVCKKWLVKGRLSK